MPIVQCAKCLKPWSEEDFWPKQRYCKTCARNYKRTNRAPITKSRIASIKKYNQNHKDRRLKSTREWRARNREKYLAHAAVRRAIKTGRITKQPCWCGAVNSQAHHADYSQRLLVIWLCQKHHKELHRREWNVGRTEEVTSR